ncbi:hypothetical protein SDJN02_23753, partial [Cucurbita argyrosperma subsp. argyrosperma]
MLPYSTLGLLACNQYSLGCHCSSAARVFDHRLAKRLIIGVKSTYSLRIFNGLYCRQLTGIEAVNGKTPVCQRLHVVLLVTLCTYGNAI